MFTAKHERDFGLFARKTLKRFQSKQLGPSAMADRGELCSGRNLVRRASEGKGWESKRGLWATLGWWFGGLGWSVVACPRWPVSGGGTTHRQGCSGKGEGWWSGQ